MKILAIGDPHIRRHAEFSRPTEDGLTEHLHAIRDSLEWLRALVLSEQPHMVVCLGDVHDSPEGVDAQSLATAARGWENLAEACQGVGADLHFLVGNHDRYSGFVHTLEHYAWLGDHVQVHSEPTLITHSRHKILMLPWERELPQVLPVDDLPALCFSHQELVGATLWGSRREDKGLDPSTLARFVCQGHYHIPHAFRNVVCPGSLVAKSFSDLEDHDSPGRGAVMLTVAPDGTTSWEMRPNPHSPRFVDLHIPDDTELALSLADDSRIRARLFYPQDEVEMAQAIAESVSGRVRLVAQDSAEKVTRALPADVDVEDPVAVLCAFGQLEGLDGDTLSCGLEIIEEATSDTSGARALLTPIRVRIQNFFSWKELELALPRRGLILIEGDNGAGKTTLISEAILWAFTGETTERQNGRVDTVCRLMDPSDPTSGLATPTVVEVTCYDEIAQREVVVIRRRHAEPKLELLLGGESVAGHRQAASQQQVDDALQLDTTALMASNFLVHGFSGAFSRLSPGKRLTYFEQVLRLDVYDRARALADSRRKAAQRDADRARGAADAADAAFAAAERRRDVELPDKLRAAEQRLREAQAEIADQLQRAQGQVAIETAAIREAERVALAAASKAERLVPHVQMWNTQLREASNRAASLLAQHRALEVQFNEQMQLLDAGQCPTCGQSTEDCAVDHITELTARQSAVHDEWVLAAEETRQLDAKYQRVRDKHQDATGDERRARRQVADARVRLRGAQAQVEALRGGVVHLEQEVGRYRAQLAEADTAVARAREASRVAHVRLGELEAVVSQWAYWYKALSSGGLRLDVLGRALADVNDRLATLAADMLDFGVALDNDGASRGRAGLAVRLTGTAKTLAHLSSGQRRALDFVIQLALSEMAQLRAPGALKLLVADEVIDTLDPENLSRVVGVMEVMSRDQLVLMTAHNPAMRALIPTRWSVRMGAAGSELTR